MRSMVEGSGRSNPPRGFEDCRGAIRPVTPYRERDTPPSGLTACHLPFQGRNG